MTNGWDRHVYNCRQPHRMLCSAIKLQMVHQCQFFWFFVIITVNVIRTPNERRVGEEARLLSGTVGMAFQTLGQKFPVHKGVRMKIFWLFPIRTKWKPYGLLTQERGTISSSQPLLLKQVESYQRPDFSPPTPMTVKQLSNVATM